MKKLNIILLSLLVSLTAVAQDDEIRTLFSKDAHNGAYFGLDFQYGQTDNHELASAGARLSWVMAHNLAIGLAAQGFFSDFDYNTELDEYHNLQGGSAGLMVEPIIGAKLPIHISVPMYFGVGGVSYTTSYHDYFNDPVPYYDDDPGMYYDDFDTFLMFKPGVEVELNLLKFFRIGFGTYYTLTTDINLENTNTNGLNGWNTGVSLKFGVF